jgi:NADPH:quinone reductase-like Zn-dependent oxidoreductase
MATPENQAAWLIKAGTPLQVSDAPLPKAGLGELVVKNAAIAINPLDCSMTTQLAAVAGIHVIPIAGAHNFGFSRLCGATQVFDRNDPSIVDHVVQAVKNSGQHEFVGIFDAISTPETYTHGLVILSKSGGGHLACVHPPPTVDVPVNVKSGMIFVVGKSLEYIQEALEKCKAGVSTTKLVVEL